MSDQTRFSAALLDPRLPCPHGLCSSNGADPASRFAVYRNNVQSSLSNALADSYPVVMQLVGEAFFRAMAGVYVQHCPPASPILNHYGQDFGDFIQDFAPAASVPYLADVARLERLRINAYHAADATPVSPEQLGHYLADPESLITLRMHLHPSLAVLDSAHAVVSLWQAHQGEGRLEQIDPTRGEAALILRQHWQVEVFRIDSGTLAFIRSLQNDAPLAQAIAGACEAGAGFDPSQALALLIRHSAIIHLQSEEKARP
ncbi:HvfC/BufC N-terminal domain-containing protein [Pseudomonas gingeri]|uniref:Putative DNA-binding domain-containing protein n=1 Tax=Pseudomonas gingeri TaxID=117681 RepID=A0A7Y7YB04_9PSED|nr:DNA-binding domain-containing protein [Pseudomonas gingeri]NWA05139.1 putative DNA-binding domain-containing protein [Pseudomonas gingeri]NWA16422.1 putative DNA-binding domain-containing protein [Pseudomonas gingeri]NWA54694.1 putative DNA-binding domain-containing protein [Pseudomonas gingeri]NWA99083.1 putative DNA-binding domain-containing protein [Pseudomonas gingeri]NWB05649.1 putative DNA-binding domain-containing protein [Pseudomonas gingeri]